jgi:hypothetical protein
VRSDAPRESALASAVTQRSGLRLSSARSCSPRSVLCRSLLLSVHRWLQAIAGKHVDLHRILRARMSTGGSKYKVSVIDRRRGVNGANGRSPSKRSGQASLAQPHRYIAIWGLSDSKKPRPPYGKRGHWSGRRDSNPRQPAWKAGEHLRCSGGAISRAERGNPLCESCPVRLLSADAVASS